MPSQAFDFGSPPANNSSFIGTGAYVDAVHAPAGNPMLNGDTRIMPSGIVMYLGGNGGARSGSIFVGGSSLAVGIPSGGPGAVGGPCTAFGLVDTGVVRVGFSTSGLTYYGWNGLTGRTIRQQGTGGVLQNNGEFAGYFDYIMSPTAPRTLAVTMHSTSADLTWVAPADSGGEITQYAVEWTTDPTWATGVFLSDISPVTSCTVPGLTAGQVYYFRVGARNRATNLAGSSSPWSNTVSGTTGTVPTAPQTPAAAAGAGTLAVTWATPTSDGGVAITGYRVDYDTSNTFPAPVAVNVGAAARSATIPGLVPGQTYYARVVAVNSVGNSAASTTVSATLPARDVLDVVRSATFDIDDMQLSIRSDGANAPTLTLGYVAFGTGTAFVTIANIPVAASVGSFAAPGGQRNITACADPAGNIYVIGTDGGNGSVLVKFYARTGTTAWAAPVSLSQALAGGTDPLVAYEAIYVAGSGVTPIPTVLVLARRSGEVATAGNISFATLDLAALAAGTGTLFLSSGTDPAWLSTPPTVAAANSGVLDVAALPSNANRLAVMANGFAVIDVTNGAIAGVAKSPANTALASASWARVIGINASTFAMLTVTGGALAWAFYNTSGSLLGSGSYAGANAQGGAFTDQWDAFLDRVAGLITVYYVSDDAGARQLESIDISPVTYVATAAAVLTAALGAASSTNGALRVPQGTVDERRVLVEAANLLTGVKATAAYVDTTGNVAPSAPTLITPSNFDATQAQVLGFTFADPDPLDTQTAYEVQVQRVSDSVNVVATGSVASAAATYGVAANTLTNAVNYRWRARTTDKLGAVGAWSSYQAFTTAALGTLTITTPASDNLAGINTSSLNIVWTYVQGNGYTQTQRRVRVIRTSDGTVLSDTTMQASTTPNYTVTGLPSDVEVRVEVSIVTNAPGTPTVLTTRLVTSSYAAPMAPLATVTVGVSSITITAINPAPIGSRPEVTSNSIDKRLTGSTDPWVRIASVPRNGSYTDHAVKSGKSYDYRVRGVA